jgi:hypothetical protein
MTNSLNPLMKNESVCNCVFSAFKALALAGLSLIITTTATATARATNGGKKMSPVTPLCVQIKK